MNNNFFEDDKFKDRCGVFGMYNSDSLDTATIAYFALHALQHRGQQSAGIASSNGKKMNFHKALGLVTEVFHAEELKQFAHQKVLIGHVSYPAGDEKSVNNAQPIVARYRDGFLACAHNGALVNSKQLINELTERGALLQTDVDSEIFVFLTALYAHMGMEPALKETMRRARGSYALVMMTQTELIGMRDPMGIRPLCLGKIDNSYILSSESCAFEAIGATFIRDILPGEIVIIDENGMRSLPPAITCNGCLCSFEHVYFARPDSVIDGLSVYQARINMGKVLANVMPVEAEIVAGVPDSALAAALGYSYESGIPYGDVLVKNRYVGRTFIQPTQAMRENAVRMKLSALAHSVKGKRVILVDDSIVRGTTSARLVNLLRDAGAKEVHMRISSPPVIHPCCYGIDTPNRKKLISHTHSTDAIRQKLGADTLAFMRNEDLLSSLSESYMGFCIACFNGKYPT